MAWANQPQWCILETSFGAGRHFLAAWQAWALDPRRPKILHVVAISEAGVHLENLPVELGVLSTGLQPGFNRFSFANGHVLLTLCVGDLNAMLAEQQFEADTLFLSDRPEQPWDNYTAKLIARCCRRGTRVSTMTLARQAALMAAGFTVETPPTAGTPGLAGVQFNPPWALKRRAPDRSNLPQPGTCIVIGAGLAGACIAASMARRGWAVQVLDAASAPANGASGLPAGLYAPYTSADHGMLSRLTMSGVRMTQQLASDWLMAGVDWQNSGVMERKPAHPERWHANAGWIKPARLVEACLSRPGVTWRKSCHVERLERDDESWSVWGNTGQLLAKADVVVIAAAFASMQLLKATFTHHTLPLQAIRGQVTCGLTNDPSWSDFPINGHGSFIPSVTTDTHKMWIAGASYDRDNTHLEPTAAEQVANFERLRILLPDVSQLLKPAFDANQVTNWVGIRCASPDRLPIVGQIEAGLWVCTALASRGLTLAPLCAELLAAQLQGEPLPLDRRQARALGVERLVSAPN